VSLPNLPVILRLSLSITYLFDQWPGINPPLYSDVETVTNFTHGYSYTTYQLLQGEWTLFSDAYSRLKVHIGQTFRAHCLAPSSLTLNSASPRQTITAINREGGGTLPSYSGNNLRAFFSHCSLPCRFFQFVEPVLLLFSVTN
jgi:hypothetical protein